MSLFEVKDKVAVITGAAGILCGGMARALAKEGVKVGVLDLNGEKAEAVAAEIREQGGSAIGVKANVLERDSLIEAKEEVLKAFGRVDVLINGAGGNKKEATADDKQLFFDMPPEAVQWVFNLNFIGTVLATQVFGKIMAEQNEGVIINISSMASIRPLTRTVSYSAAKAGINNFTQWLAVYFNQNFSKNVRVNAIAPGFFLTEQNRFLLTDEKTGDPTERGKKVIEHTPMGRYGTPDELIGTLIWLISDGAKFVNGVIVPVDGGFSVYSGV